MNKQGRLKGRRSSSTSQNLLSGPEVLGSNPSQWESFENWQNGSNKFFFLSGFLRFKTGVDLKLKEATFGFFRRSQKNSFRLRNLFWKIRVVPECIRRRRHPLPPPPQKNFSYPPPLSDLLSPGRSIRSVNFSHPVSSCYSWTSWAWVWLIEGQRW